MVNQGSVPLCTAAVVSALAAYFARRARAAVIRPSVLFNYRMARHVMGEPDRRGARIEAGITAWQRFGMPDEASWPWTPTSIDLDPPPGLVPAAGSSSEIVSWRISSAEITTHLRVLRAALRLGLPVVCEFPLHVSQFTAFETGIVPLPREGERPLARHTALLVGSDDVPRRFRVRNSRGPEWGDRRYGALPYAYVERGLTGDSRLLTEKTWTTPTDDRTGLGVPAVRTTPEGHDLD